VVDTIKNIYLQAAFNKYVQNYLILSKISVFSDIYPHKAMHLIFYLLPLLAGITMTLQAAVNNQLRQSVGSPLVAGFISFLVGTFILGLAVVFTQQKIPSFQALSRIEVYKFAGGLLGVYFVTSGILVAPRIGVTNMSVLIISGQLLMALLFDYFGWLGFKQNPISFNKIIGALLCLIAVYLINKK
jgi:bacterial/archaeal transporter family-2 protein